MATTTADTATALVDSLRTRISQAAPNHADLVIQTLIEAIQAKKKVSVTCRKCDTPNRAEILDAVAATNAIKLLIEQTEGRPGVADEAEHDKVTITRLVRAPTDTQAAAQLLTEAGWHLTAPEGHAGPSAHTDARD